MRRRVERARPGTFSCRRDFEGISRAVESALSRLPAEGGLVRVQRGLCRRETRTRSGTMHPGVLDVAVVIGGPGSGPAGVDDAQLLSLTTPVTQRNLQSLHCRDGQPSRLRALPGEPDGPDP